MKKSEREYNEFWAGVQDFQDQLQDLLLDLLDVKGFESFDTIKFTLSGKIEVETSIGPLSMTFNEKTRRRP